MGVFAEAARLERENVPFAVLTIVRAKGSTPRHSAKMIVLKDGSQIGTIGGGPVEKKSTEDAVICIAEGRSGVFEYTLNSDVAGGLPMSCGGNMEIHIDVFNPRPKLLLVGAGHVNHALYRFAHDTGFEVVISDDRENLATTERFPNASSVYYDEDIKEAVRQAIEGGWVDDATYVVIATKDCDEAALRAIIDTKTKYVGLIGSRRKIKVIRENLKGDGYADEAFDFIHWPIGLDIGAETPEEIAISILAEILKVKSGASGLKKRDMFVSH